MKVVHYFLTGLLFVCAYLFFPFSSTSMATAAEGHITKEANAYVTDVQLYSQYVENPQTSFDVFESVSVHYDWAVPDDVKIANGDQMVFQLPNQLKIADGIDTFNVHVSENDDTVVGVAAVNKSDQTVTITFNDYFETNVKDKVGTLAFWTNWNWQQQNTVEINDLNELDFGYATVPIRVTNVGPADDESIGKYGWIDVENNVIEWRVRINYAKDSLTNVVYEDILGEGQRLVSDVNVQYGQFNDDLEVSFTKTTDRQATIEKTDRGFKVALGDLNKLSAYISYKTAPTGTLNNEYENTGKLTAQGENIATQTVWTPKSGASGTGSGKPTATFSVMKQWQDDNDEAGKRPDSIEVKLYQNDQPTDKTVVLNEDDGWFATFKGLAKYDKDDVAYRYSVKEVDVPEGYTSTVDGAVITNTYEKQPTPEPPATTTVSGKKIWKDNDNQDGKRPTSITVYLLADGEKVGSKSVTAKDDWTYEFTNLPKYHDDALIEYRVDEQKVDGYRTKIVGNNLVNTYKPATTAVSGKKIWKDNDNQDGKRPESIIVSLFANNKKVDEKRVTAKSNWTYRFADLPKYVDGQLIQYHVDEQKVAGYRTTIEGYDIVNTHKPKTTTIPIVKKWEDQSNAAQKRPEDITVVLLANGKTIETKQLNAQMNWQYTFENMPVYKNGQKIDYQIVEVPVPAYKTSIDGFTITNYYMTTVTNNNPPAITPNPGGTGQPPFTTTYERPTTTLPQYASTVTQQLPTTMLDQSARSQSGWNTPAASTMPVTTSSTVLPSTTQPAYASTQFATNTANNQMLPQTGERSTLISIIGAILILGSIAIFAIRKRRVVA